MGVENGDLDLEAKDSGGYNACDIAAMFGWTDLGVNGDVANIVQYLKDKGLAHTWGGAYKFTAFELACKYGRHALARYLLTLGAVVPRDVCQLQIPWESDITGYT